MWSWSLCIVADERSPANSFEYQRLLDRTSLTAMRGCDLTFVFVASCLRAALFPVATVGDLRPWERCIVERANPPRTTLGRGPHRALHRLGMVFGRRSSATVAVCVSGHAPYSPSDHRQIREGCFLSVAR